MGDTEKTIPTSLDADKEYTIGELYGPAMLVQTEIEAANYFELLVKYMVDRYQHTPEHSQEVIRSNIGYYTGYYNSKTMVRVQKLFKAAHPILGRAEGSKSPSPEVAFEAGQLLVEGIPAEKIMDQAKEKIRLEKENKILKADIAKKNACLEALKEGADNG